LKSRIFQTDSETGAERKSASSLAAKAPALQAGYRGFESLLAHHSGVLLKM
jgi:hypothetical protein